MLPLAGPLLLTLPAHPALPNPSAAQVVHELLPLEILLLLLESPSDDSVEVAVDFVKEVRGLFRTSLGKRCTRLAEWRACGTDPNPGCVWAMHVLANSSWLG